ncbi:MAG TPA: diguanylate cyclase [Longimicrobium sp.]|nr:diguanylate cyclase [Longimicrobium sp.]
MTILASDKVEFGALADGAETRMAVDGLVRRAWEARFSDPREALRLAERARSLAEWAGYPSGLAYALRARGACRAELLENDAALADLQAAVRAFEEVGDAAGKAGALSRIGNVHRHRGDCPAALAPLLEALRLQREVGDREGESDTLNFLGNVYFELDDLARALEHYRDSRRLKEALADARGLSQVLNNLGNIHGRLGEYAESLDHFRRALALMRELGDRDEIVPLLNIGASHENLDELDEALECFRTALGQARRSGDPRAECIALTNLGNVFRKRGDLPQSLACFEEALEVSRSAEQRHVENETLLRLGETLAGAGDDARARVYLDAALELAERTGARARVYEVHRVLAELHERRGDAAGALRHVKLHHEVKDEVFGAAAERRIQTLLVQAEVERTEREAGLLRTRNDELTAVNRALREAQDQLRLQAAELERLAREDAVTGLCNRRELDARLALEWERARRFGRELTVAMADLDHFKAVNDRFSHAVGDRVLREVAAIFRRGTRQVDVVGRYGGEELVLLLVETPPSKAARLAEKLRAAVEAHDWEAIAPGLKVTVSLGLCGDRALGTPEALLAAADAKLYEAKRAGRNQVR